MVIVEGYAKLLKDLDGDSELIREIYSIFLKELPANIAELRQMYNNGDIVRLNKKVHYFKGQLLNIRIIKSPEVFIEFEDIIKNGISEAAFSQLEIIIGILNDAFDKIDRFIKKD